MLFYQLCVCIVCCIHHFRAIMCISHHFTIIEIQYPIRYNHDFFSAFLFGYEESFFSRFLLMPDSSYFTSFHLSLRRCSTIVHSLHCFRCWYLLSFDSDRRLVCNYTFFFLYVKSNTCAWKILTTTAFLNTSMHDSSWMYRSILISCFSI